MRRLMDVISGLNAFLCLIFLVSLYQGILCQAQMHNMEYDGTSLEPWNKEAFKEEAAQTYNLVFHKYNRRVRPPVVFVEVDLAVTLAHIRHLDIIKQELQTVLNIEADWMDSRLQWIPHKLRSIHSNTSSVWYPDIVYTNGVSPVKSLYPDMVRIMSNGAVRWSKKEIVTTQCRTQPEVQTQNCSIELGFLSNSRGDNLDRFFSNRSSVTVLGDFENHEWRLMEMDMQFDDNNDTKSTIIRIDLTLKNRQHHETGTGSTAAGSKVGAGNGIVPGKDNNMDNVENCTEVLFKVDEHLKDRGNHQYLSPAMLLLIMVTSLGLWFDGSLGFQWNSFAR